MLKNQLRQQKSWSHYSIKHLFLKMKLNGNSQLKMVQRAIEVNVNEVVEKRELH